MFFVPFLIMLREGLEAALIVSLIAGYLKRTQRGHWMPAVWGGVFSAALLCLAIGYGINETTGEFPQKQQELFEAIVAAIAVGMLTYMVFWMRKAAASVKTDLHSSIDKALGKHQGSRQGWALVGMVFLAVAREGLESVFFLLSAFQQGAGTSAPLGAVTGLALAVLLGFAIYLGGLRLPLGAFFRWTSLFILFVAAGLAAGAIRSLHEAGIWNYFQSIAFNASDLLSTHSVFGTLLEGLLGYQETPTVSGVAIYFIYLLPALYWFFKKDDLTSSPTSRPANSGTS